MPDKPLFAGVDSCPMFSHQNGLLDIMNPYVRPIICPSPSSFARNLLDKTYKGASGATAGGFLTSWCGDVASGLASQHHGFLEVSLSHDTQQTWEHEFSNVMNHGELPYASISDMHMDKYR